MTAAVTVRLQDEVIDALDDIATKTDRSRDWLIGRAIEDFVALNAWQIAKIEAGLAAADRDDFASDEDLQRLRQKYAPLA